MFNFKNKYEPRKKWDPNDPSTWANKGLSGLSKYWRYTTLDAQNNNNFDNNINIPTSNNINNYSSQGNCTSPDDITLEISYDNFYTLGVDMMKKKKYAEELRKQIEEKEMIKKLERQKKKLDDLNDDIRIEKERKMIEDRQRQNNRRSLPKINITPYYPLQKVQEPIKIYTPPPPPPIPIIKKYKTPSKPIINTDYIRNYSYEAPPKTKYIYRKVYNTEETKNYLRNRENEIEKFNRDMDDQLKMLKNDFNSGMKKLNDEVDSLNDGLGKRNHNFRYLMSQKISEISADIQNNNNKKRNIQTEHIYNVIRKSKDGKMTIQRFMGNPNFINLPVNDNQYIIKQSNLLNGDIFYENDILYDEIPSNSMKLPYINLSHCISYS